MSSQGDGKLYARNPYIGDNKKQEKPKKEKKTEDHIQLYIIQNSELSEMLGHPTYYNYMDACWNSNIDRATRFEGKDDARIPEDYKDKFVFLEVER